MFDAAASYSDTAVATAAGGFAHAEFEIGDELDFLLRIEFRFGRLGFERDGDVIGFGDADEAHVDGLNNGLGDDAIGFVVVDLNQAAAKAFALALGTLELAPQHLDGAEHFKIHALLMRELRVGIA